MKKCTTAVKMVEGFIGVHLRKLCVILRSRALLAACVFMKDDLWVNTLESALRHDRRGRASPRYELCRSNPCAKPSYSSDDIPIYVPAEPTKHVLNNFPKKSLPCHITQNDVS